MELLQLYLSGNQQPACAVYVRMHGTHKNSFMNHDCNVAYQLFHRIHISDILSHPKKLANHIDAILKAINKSI